MFYCCFKSIFMGLQKFEKCFYAAVEISNQHIIGHSESDHQCLNVESCVWREVSSHSSYHPQEVLLAQFSLYVHKGGLKPHSFHLHLSNVKEPARIILSFGC